MPNSLRSKISSLRYKGKITDEEYKDLISKLDGHDKALKTPWIPCSERLPEVGDTYLVTVTYKGEVLAVDAACFGPDCHYIDDMWATYIDWIEDDPELYHVTAWMPLPDAYEGGENNGK